MKKKLFLLMIILPAMLATGRAYADDFIVGNIKYNITSTEVPLTVEVIANSYSGDVVIPNSVEYEDETYAVTAIGSAAFFGCNNLESVVIGNSVKTIGSAAFNSCIKLTSVVIPNSVETIEDYVFSFCVNLTSVVIGNSVETIGEGAFANNNNNITEIIVKAETSPLIPSYAFGNPFNGSIHVPCYTEETYKIAGNWASYAEKIVGDVSPDITLESNDETMGKPVLVQENTCDDPAVIEATANPGYRFVQWNDDNTANPRTVTVTEDVTFTAIFAPAAYLPVLLQDLEDAIICRGESHTFKIVAEGENLTYEWYYGDNLIKGANTNSYTITHAEFRDYERYYVIVRSRVGESRVSVYSKNVRLWVADQLPETLQFVEFPSTAVTGKTYPIKLAGYSDVTQYSWSYDRDDVTFSPKTGGVGDNETLATFGVLSAGQGMLTVTLEHPCGTRQATQAVLVQYPTGVEQVAGQAVRVFPNPTSGIIKVSGTKSNQIIRIVDITGSLKGKYPTQDGETTIDLTGYSKGTYLIQYNGKTVKAIRK